MGLNTQRMVVRNFFFLFERFSSHIGLHAVVHVRTVRYSAHVDDVSTQIVSRGITKASTS